ncbi:MAG: acyltransferase [Anaerolineae bacterium]|nr:acyltransferase [Anaerolineae bacterium]
MVRRLSLLNGVSILAVVLAHAGGWVFIAMYYWADRYFPAVPASYDPAGTLPYYIVLALRNWGSFAVPSFLFVTGYFIAYAARGGQSRQPTLSYKTVLARLKVLLIPYLIWSAVIYVGDALQGNLRSPFVYLINLFVGGAHPVYFYIPLLCQFYLLAPLVVSVAWAKPAKLLIGSVVLHLGVLIVRYLHLFVREMPVLQTATDLLFPMYALAFSLGMVWGYHPQWFKEGLARARHGLLVVLVVLAVLVLLESELVFRTTGVRWGAGPGLLSTSLYSIALIFCFLAFDSISLPFPKLFQRLGVATYGLYLLHPLVLEFFARATQKFAPKVLAYPVVFQMALTAATIGAALLFMTAVSKSPLRRWYRTLFG